MESMKQRTWENPYKQALRLYPDRIYTFDEGSDDAYRLYQEIVALKTVGRTVHIELGSGSGAHLIELGRRFPASSNLGFEIRYKRAVRTIEKAIATGVENCFIARTSYDDFSELLPPESVDKIYVNFPDPWAKKRWLKHRILSNKLIDQAAKVLKPNGLVSIKTDHQEYFASFVEVVRADTRVELFDVTEDLYASTLAAESIATEFESLFRRQGLPIYHLSFGLHRQR